MPVQTDGTSDFPAELRGSFQPLRLLGTRGMGRVFLVRDLRTPREVALEVLRGSDDPSLEARFSREAEALGRISHPTGRRQSPPAKRRRQSLNHGTSW